MVKSHPTRDILTVVFSSEYKDSPMYVKIQFPVDDKFSPLTIKFLVLILQEVTVVDFKLLLLTEPDIVCKHLLV